MDYWAVPFMAKNWQAIDSLISFELVARYGGIVAKKTAETGCRRSKCCLDESISANADFGVVLTP